MLRKFFLILILILPLKVSAISAEAYIVMDADSKRIIEGKNIDKEKLIASTTKIMTCIIALENGDLNQKVTVGQEVLQAYGSAIYLSLNEQITLKDLLYGLMLRSGNDAAIEIAYAISDNMPNFVAKMNEKAYELGMSHTKFINNHGLEDNKGQGNTSTAKDMALLMQYALQNETFKTIINTKNYQAKTSGKTYSWTNKNKLLFTYDNMIGGKTGYTKKALRTLVTAASKDHKTTIVVTLNDGNDFQDHKTLHEQVLNNYEKYDVLTNETIPDLNNYSKYYIKEPFSILVKENEKSQIKVDFQINDSSTEEVGQALIYLGDEYLSSVKIYQHLEEKNAKNSGFFAKFFRWLFKW